jgi:hypothetical protein
MQERPCHELKRKLKLFFLVGANPKRDIPSSTFAGFGLLNAMGLDSWTLKIHEKPTLLWDLFHYLFSAQNPKLGAIIVLGGI